jgi:hypothetical protein
MASKENMLARARSDYVAWHENSGDYQYRFCYEFVELEARIERLKRYLMDPVNTDPISLERLKVQLKIMEAYREIMLVRYDSDQL